MRTTKNQSLFISIFVSLFIVVSIPFSTAAEWNERMCETGDYIPLTLYGVWGSSPVDIFFVGDSGYVLHYDGSQCAVMWGNPFTGKIANLYDIWGSSKNDVFAVGGNNGEILHYDGVKWTLMRKALVDQQLYGIWGYSPQDVFAVGSGGVILHYDGETWSEMDSGTVFTLNDIWGTTPDNIFAVGNAGTILHYNGEMWSAASNVGRNLYGVWGSSNQDVYAVGDGPYVNPASGSIFYYDGKSSFWNERFRYIGRYLKGVWGSSANDVYFVGGIGPLVGVNSGIILHYDGITSPVVHGDSPGMMHDIWGSSWNDVYAVGFGYRVLHYDGSETVTTTILSSTTTTSIPLITSSTTTPVSTTTTKPPQCVAEVLYGDNSEETELLRNYRDSVLSITPEGQKIIKIYYKYCPTVINLLGQNPNLKNRTKAYIDSMLPKIKHQFEESQSKNQ